MRRLVELQARTGYLSLKSLPSVTFRRETRDSRPDLRCSHECKSLKSSYFTQPSADTVMFRPRRNFCKFRLTP